MEALEEKVVYLMRKVVGAKVRKEEAGDRMPNQKLREMLGVDSVEKLIRRRRLQWVAHSARRRQSYLTWSGLRRELEDPKSGWGEQVRKDWKELGVKGVDQWVKLVEDRAWLRNMLKSEKAADDAAL